MNTGHTHTHTHTHTEGVIYNRVEGNGSLASQGLFWEVQPSISQADSFSVIPGEQYRAACLSSSGLPSWVTLTLPPSRKTGPPGQQWSQNLSFHNYCYAPKMPFLLGNMFSTQSSATAVVVHIHLKPMETLNLKYFSITQIFMTKYAKIKVKKHLDVLFWSDLNSRAATISQLTEN